MLTKQRVVLAKEESVYGSDPTPTVASNAIEAKNVKTNYAGEKLERDQVREHLSPLTPVMGKRYIELTFEYDLKGSGSAGVAPKVGDLLEACGFAETATVGSSVVYKPSTNSIKSLTFYVYDYNGDGASAKLHKIKGARGTAKIIAEAGMIARVEFSFKGLYTVPTDVAQPSDPTFSETTKPPIVESSEFTLNSVTSLVVQSLQVDVGNKLTDQDDISSSGGIKGFVITSRRPVGSFNPEAVLLATYDFYSDWVGASARELSAIVGSVAGNKITITAPKVTIDNIGEADKDGIRTHDIPFSLSADAGNDEMEIKFE